MIGMRVLPKVDENGGMPELSGRTCVRTETFTVTSLRGGMGSGKPSVALIVDLPDGSYVMAETSLALFIMAARALEGAHADERAPSAAPTRKPD